MSRLEHISINLLRGTDWRNVVANCRKGPSPGKQHHYISYDFRAFDYDVRITLDGCNALQDACLRLPTNTGTFGCRSFVIFHERTKQVIVTINWKDVELVGADRPTGYFLFKIHNQGAEKNETLFWSMTFLNDPAAKFFLVEGLTSKSFEWPDDDKEIRVKSKSAYRWRNVKNHLTSLVTKGKVIGRRPRVTPDDVFVNEKLTWQGYTLAVPGVKESILEGHGLPDEVVEQL